MAKKLNDLNKELLKEWEEYRKKEAQDKALSAFYIDDCASSTTAGSNMVNMSLSRTRGQDPVKQEDLTFYKVLSWLSLIASGSMAYIAGWGFNSLSARFELLRWFLTTHHTG